MKKVMWAMLCVALALAIGLAAVAEGETPFATLWLGSKGEAVEALQNQLERLGYLTARVSKGFFGYHTKVAVIAFQQDNGLRATGIVDEAVYEAVLACELTALRRGDKGDAVQRLQERLAALGYDVGTPDGSFGSKTEQAVTKFQKEHTLEPTGVADAHTQLRLYSPEVEAEIGQVSEPVARGIDYISAFAMEYAPTVFGALAGSQRCGVVEVYCQEDGSDTYRFTALVEGGGKRIGFGKDLRITERPGGGWDVEEASDMTMYMDAGLKNIPGEAVWTGEAGDDYSALADAFQGLGALGTDGDG